MVEKSRNCLLLLPELMAVCLQMEFESHDCEPKQALFQCDICEKRFRTNKALTAHYYKHTMTFDCQLCHRSFESRSSDVNI